jgi:hypothetical protein
MQMELYLRFNQVEPDEQALFAATFLRGKAER